MHHRGAASKVFNTVFRMGKIASKGTALESLKAAACAPTVPGGGPDRRHHARRYQLVKPGQVIQEVSSAKVQSDIARKMTQFKLALPPSKFMPGADLSTGVKLGSGRRVASSLEPATDISLIINKSGGLEP